MRTSLEMKTTRSHLVIIQQGLKLFDAGVSAAPSPKAYATLI